MDLVDVAQLEATPWISQQLTPKSPEYPNRRHPVRSKSHVGHHSNRHISVDRWLVPSCKPHGERIEAGCV